MAKEQISPEVLALLRINGLIMDGLIKSGAVEASWFVENLDRLAREAQHGPIVNGSSSGNGTLVECFGAYLEHSLIHLNWPAEGVGARPGVVVSEER